MIEHDGVTLYGFDQELWARLGNYAMWNASEALELFRLLREANLRMLHTLSPEQWERSGSHVERGTLTSARTCPPHGSTRYQPHQADRKLARCSEVAIDDSFQEYCSGSAGSSTAPAKYHDCAAATCDSVARSRRCLASRPCKKWCIKEVIGHLTEEDKRDFAGRIEAMLDELEPSLKLNDQEEVARDATTATRMFAIYWMSSTQYGAAAFPL